MELSLLTAVNAIIPALAAGNMTTLRNKPLVAERLHEAANAVDGVGDAFKSYIVHDQVAELVQVLE